MQTNLITHCLLPQVVETEASREALRKELANLQRKYAELEDELRLRERDYTLALEDSRRSEKKLDDQRRNLEIQLETASSDIAELKVSSIVVLLSWEVSSKGFFTPKIDTTYRPEYGRAVSTIITRRSYQRWCDITILTPDIATTVILSISTCISCRASYIVYKKCPHSELSDLGSSDFSLWAPCNAGSVSLISSTSFLLMHGTQYLFLMSLVCPTFAWKGINHDRFFCIYWPSGQDRKCICFSGVVTPCWFA